MSIEKLTATEREHRRLQGMTDFAGECEMESLEMYLAAESRAEALQARVAELEADRITELDARVRFAERADAAEAELATAKARVAELEREVESSDAGRDSAFDLIEQKNNELDAAHEALETAESELADLRGRVERALQHLQICGVKMPGNVWQAMEALRGR